MFGKALVMYIYAEMPIHPGSGTTLGVVDLPIQRERHTEFPMIQGSSLKGVMRNSAEDVGIDGEVEIGGDRGGKKAWIDIIFGEQDRVGGISITDARILAFPVRTLKGVFGWITCPLVLDRYKRDLGLAGIKVNWEIPVLSSDEEARVCEDSNLIDKHHIYIEELQLRCKKDKSVKEIAEQIAENLLRDGVHKNLKKKFKEDLIVVS
ncbi:MAG: type III-B CRISPR module RAMP protein Cmr4, partial [Thermoplasmata archaeon]|nr:type III-B CRISPR module RAMP protein Cmr4 [Thermoplasmata archaeon]